MTTCTLNCTDYTPVFTAGSTPCTLQTSAESRARKQEGLLFRSIAFGTVTNNIVIECTWYDAGDIVTTDPASCDHYKVFVYDGVNPQEVYGPYSQTYTGTPTPMWSSPDLGALITAINSGSSLVNVFNSSAGDINFTGSAPTYMPTFGITNLAGGAGEPVSPTGVRTGPYESLFFITTTESSDGSALEIREIRHWTTVPPGSPSGSWEVYNPSSPPSKTCFSTCT